MDVIVPQFVIAPDHTDTTKATLLSSSITADSSDIWASGTTYAADDVKRYMDTTGSEAGVWKTYISLQNANTGNNPQTATAWWTSLGATERYKMFDLYTMTETTDASANIVVNLYCRRITSIAFLNVQASAITVEAWKGTELADKIAGNVIDTYSVSLKQDINDWYEYFFSDFDYIRDVAITGDIANYYNVVLQITFTKLSGQDCYVGQCIPGRKYILGKTKYGVQSGIDDYSKIEEDDIFGETYLSQGNYKKTLDIDLIVDNTNLNQTNSILTQLRAIPTVWQANESGTEYDNMLVYGFCKKFKIIIPHSSYSECNLEIRGMI